MLKRFSIINFSGIVIILLICYTNCGFCQNLIFAENNSELGLINSMRNILSRNKNNLINNNFDIKNKIIEKNLKYNETLCDQQFGKIIEQIIEAITSEFIKIPDPWFMKLFDSWGKIPAGILSGHFREIGNFDQCLKYHHSFNETELGSFGGQYCTVAIPLKVINETLGGGLNIEFDETALFGNIGFQFGLCLPDTCTPEKINVAFLSLLNMIPNIEVEGQLITGCQINKPITFTTVDYVAFVIFGLVAILMLLSSIYDSVMRHKNKKPHDILIAYSVITNCEKLFKISTTKSPNTIGCLNGMRCISLVWVVLGHSYIMFMNGGLVNSFEVFSWFTTLFSSFMRFGTVSVDTFLFLSGLLLIWTAFREMEKTKGRLNFIMMYVHRYIRLTPALAAAVLFCVSFLKYIGSGPFWEQNIPKLVKDCEDGWWKTLLYVQNYASVTTSQHICIPQSWYLAVDTQLFFLSPLVLIPLWKWGRKVIVPIIILALLSNACVFTTFMNWNFSTINILNMKTDDQMRLTYFPTHTRYSPWLMGVLIGYILFETRIKRVKLSKIILIVGWLISVGTLLAVLFGPYHRAVDGASNPSKIESAAYEAFGRVSWSIALGWIVFACHNGYGGVVNSMLSSSIWEPFSRLTYSVYIVHFILQYMVNGNLKHDNHFSNFDVIYKFWGDLGLTICVSIVLVLSFESPIIGIEKVLFKRDKKSKSKDKDQLINIDEICHKNEKELKIRF